METALTASLLLQDRYVTYLRANCVRMQLDVHILEDFLQLCWIDLLKSITDTCLLVVRIHLVVVAEHDALVLAHANVWNQIGDDFFEEVHGVFSVLISLRG